MNKQVSELSMAEIEIIYNEWKEFKRRQAEQRLRNKKQREVLRAAKAYAIENGFNPEEV